MGNTMIAFIIKFTGLEKLWLAIDGYKTNVGAAGLMLGGAAIMLSGVAAIISAYVGCADHAAQVEFFRTVMHSDNAALVLKGYLAFKGGLMGLGIGHKLEKAAAEPAA